jgi:uncharacterized protein (DUF342 family)
MSIGFSNEMKELVRALSERVEALESQVDVLTATLALTDEPVVRRKKKRGETEREYIETEWRG